MFLPRLPYLAMALSSIAAHPATAAVRYAKPVASGFGNCTSWANACTLLSAMGAAQDGDEVWVQAGTYFPNGLLALKDGVKLIGGFAGIESSASQSNPRANPTIVDGGGTSQGVGSSGNAPSAVLRGFTLQNGQGGSDDGGGLPLEDSNALIVDCVFTNNRASFGGAVGIRGSGSPQFINCIFRDNGDATGASPLGGGAVYVRDHGTPSFVNSLFYGNLAAEGGGAHVAGAFPVFTNCTMAHNEATITHGGALWDAAGRTLLKNCILWNNVAARGLGASDQILAGGGGAALATHCDIQGGWPGSTNINVDAQFVNSTAGYYALAGTSPCKDAGDDATLPPDSGDLDWDGDVDEPIPYDLAFKDRLRGAAVDMGAYELQCDGPCTGACCDLDPLGSCTDGATAAECDCPHCEWFEKTVCADVACVRESIPTVSNWGLAILAIFLATCAKVRFGYLASRPAARHS